MYLLKDASLLNLQVFSGTFWSSVRYLLPPWSQVFKKPYEVVTVLLIQTLGAMVPSVPVCVSTALERGEAEGRLEALLELHHTTSAFTHSLEAATLPHLGTQRGHRGHRGVKRLKVNMLPLPLYTDLKVC